MKTLIAATAFVALAHYGAAQAGSTFTVDGHLSQPTFATGPTVLGVLEFHQVQVRVAPDNSPEIVVINHASTVVVWEQATVGHLDF